jgi:hypothetical protein
MAAMTGQRGMVLLPVTLALAVVGTLAYAMTRDGLTNVSTVDAQYEVDRARYLAEAGVNLVKWRNQQLSCTSALGFTAPVTDVDGGTIMANTADVTSKKKGLSMKLTATTAGGAVNTVVIDDAHAVPVYDLSKKVEVTLAAQNGTDMSIRSDTGLMSSSAKLLEVSDGKAHALIKFGLNSTSSDVQVTHADLLLFQASSQSSQPGSLAVHRILRDWNTLVNWTDNWTNKGGDFAPASATLAIPGNGQYTINVTALVASWVGAPASNYGLLLKPNGLTEARFNSFEATSNVPRLFLRYYPLCK